MKLESIVTQVRKKERGDPSLISGRCGLASGSVLSIRCCVWCVLRIGCCVRLRQMRGVVGWLRPGSRFAFQHQVCQLHRMHTTQGIIFADDAWGMDRLDSQDPQFVANWAIKKETKMAAIKDMGYGTTSKGTTASSGTPRNENGTFGPQNDNQGDLIELDAMRRKPGFNISAKEYQ